MCANCYQTMTHSDCRVFRLVCITPRGLDASIGPQYHCMQSALSKALTSHTGAWKLMMGFSHVRKSLSDDGALGLPCFPVNIHHAPWPGRLSRAPIPLHAICALKSTHTSTMAMEAHDGLQPCAQIVTRRWRTRTGVFPG